MRMMLVTTFAALALLIAGAMTDTARAQADPYRWCALYSGRAGSSNCYFLTLDQCQAAVSGVGGFCQPNPFFTGNEPQRRSRRHA